MIPLLLFVIYLFLVTLIFFWAQYFVNLFSDKREQYSREELIGFRNIFVRQWNQLTGENQQLSFLGMLVGFLFALLFTTVANYFTLSAVFPIVLYFLLPFLKNRFEITEENKENFFIKLLHHDLPLFVVFSLTVLSKILVGYSLNQISFLWVLINIVLILAVLLIKSGSYQLPIHFNQKETSSEKEQSKFAHEDNSEIVSEDEENN